MNKTLQFSKYKLHDRPFNTACSEVYSEILADMSLILILLQNDPPSPPLTHLQTFAFCLGLKKTSPYL